MRKLNLLRVGELLSISYPGKFEKHEVSDPQEKDQVIRYEENY